MDALKNFTLSQLKALKKPQARELCEKLNIALPSEADTEYMRSYLRVLKIRQDNSLLNDTDYEEVRFYANQDIVSHEKLPLLSSSASIALANNPNNTDATSPYYSEPADFSTRQLPQPPNQPPPPPPTVEKPLIMAERLPCFQPKIFSGTPSENVNEFFSYYEKVALANGWNDDRKVQLLSLYVTGVAESVLDSLTREYGDNLTWNVAKQKLISSFSNTCNTQMLEMQLNTRMQAPGEATIKYTTDVIRLCHLIDANMDESRVCGHILKGLLPATLQGISMSDNSTKQKLNENIKKFEQHWLLMNCRLGIATDPLTTPITKEDPIRDLQAQVNNMTQMINQLQLQSSHDRHRTRSRDSSPQRGSRDDTYSSNSRGSSNQYGFDRSRERSVSRNRQNYDHERRPRSRDRRYQSPEPLPSRTPPRVRFSVSPRQAYQGPTTSRSQGRYYNSASNAPSRPSQPCRHCGKWGHWSQSCWSLKQKN